MTDAQEPGRLRFEVRWGVSPEGEPTVELPTGIPAGWYKPSGVEIHGHQLVAAAKRAREMAAVWKWLRAADVPEGKARELVMELSKQSDDKGLGGQLPDLSGGLSGLFGMF